VEAPLHGRWRRRVVTHGAVLESRALGSGHHPRAVPRAAPPLPHFSFLCLLLELHPLDFCSSLSVVYTYVGEDDAFSFFLLLPALPL
jgi:hypothetical protein